MTFSPNSSRCTTQKRCTSCPTHRPSPLVREEPHVPRAGHVPITNYWDLIRRANEDDDDFDEDTMHQILAQVPTEKSPSMPRMPSRASQIYRNTRPVTPQQIARIDRAIRNGTSGLPPLKTGCVWALADSGSAPHVAPQSKICGRARLENQIPKGENIRRQADHR